LKFSCHSIRKRRINGGSVKVLLPTTSGDFLRLARVGSCVIACTLLPFGGCKKNEPIDDAKAGGKTTADFPQITADVFKPMDGGIDLTPEEIMGRNTWNLWTGGNQYFWDRIARQGYGLIDLLKMLDSRNRGSRHAALGLVNEPGFRQAGDEDTKDTYGLYLDKRVGPEPPGVDPKVYGYSTGVLGFRLFPNPDFDDNAKKKWDAKRFYDDPDYYNDPSVIRPYRVGVSCGACHISYHPLHPPEDPENPKWEDLASVIGNQYIREGAVFAPNVKSGRFFWEMLKAQPPGTSDTSRIATDHINNPGAINAIFNLDARLSIASEEKISGGGVNTPYEGQVTKIAGGETRKVPHILKDGADSVGAFGATIRVYVNIGMFSQQWVTAQDPLIGLKPQSLVPLTFQKPFSVAKAQQNSVYWMATQERLENIKQFFRRLGPMHLEDAPGGADYITKDESVMNRGKIVFAESCASCHSSKRPPQGSTVDEKEWFRREVLKPDFRGNNFLSNEVRYPVTDIKTNSARAFGTNAVRGHVWDNFSSETYKDLKPVGVIECNKGTPYEVKFHAPDGGVGYYRPASLISIWSTAPFFHNNALGKFTGDPSVKGRMDAFNDAAEKLLWPDKRENTIWRTSQECYVTLSEAYLPDLLKPLCQQKPGVRGKWLYIGPIPAGTPINLIANINPEFRNVKDLSHLRKLVHDFNLAFWNIRANGADADTELKRLVPDLLAASKCPDLVEDRGHYFGTSLPDDDKRALIEFLKTL
jgi:hypothetical protein